MLGIWLPLLICIGLGWAWYHALRLREYATARARALCEQHGLQLLDDSVALHRLRVHRQHGNWRVTREYRFDTSRGGDHRQTASMTLRDGRVVASSLPSDTRPAESVPVATSPFMAASLPRAEPPAGNVVPFERGTRRTLH